MTLLPKLRLQYQPLLPDILEKLSHLKPEKAPAKSVSEDLQKLFPAIHQNGSLYFSFIDKIEHPALKVGVVFSGGQASGGHNVIAGLLDALRQLNSESTLIGFLNGPNGIIKNKTIDLYPEIVAPYRNQGGFDLIGSGRTKIETEEQFQAAEKTCREHALDGLVVIGGDDSNTNAALLAEYFVKQQCPTTVVGVPKTIDGDLKSEEIECSFGFDTACKTYSELIGNLLRDALSAKKHTFFIKLMGRSASHIALECALQTHANLTLIGEEIEAQGLTLADITKILCEMIEARSAEGKEYGIILIPEGIIEFIPEVKKLIQELNTLLALGSLNTQQVKEKLSEPSLNCFNSIPNTIQEQLLLERDSHGNVQVTKIETERLFIEMVQNELKKRGFKGKFSPQPYFCGYEGRSGLPSNFDVHYCYSLGHVAALLVAAQATGYISVVKKLAGPVEKWQIGGIPLVQLMQLEQRKGSYKPVIRKALVDLQGEPFRKFDEERKNWILNDDYRYPGPIQFFGPEELTDAITHTLFLESKAKKI